MAELAIPAVALGALYICSNKDKDAKKEGYENLNQKNLVQQETSLASYTPVKPVVNYPKLQPVNPEENVKYYPNANAATDKYFKQDLYEKQDGAGLGTNFLSLTGDAVDAKNFKHNNMVPFFGARVRGRTADADTAEGILDSMQGLGSQQFKKQERAPLFAPKDNMQLNNGAPNMNDFYQSRQNPVLKMSNVKPWEEQRVAPGLNQGYTTEGSNGFNSGMEARNSWLPKTVNELRVDSNPKMTFELAGHQGPANSNIKNTGIQGKVQKYLPDTYYLNGPDRWFTTTGAEKAQTVRSIEVEKDGNRQTTSCPYTGGAAGQDQTYTTGLYKEPNRPILETMDVAPAAAVGRFDVGDQSNELNNNQKSYDILPNNRNTTDSSFLGFINGTVNAVVAPLVDVLKPTKKQNVIGNIRGFGEVQVGVPESYVYNPAERTRTTIRQMTENGSGNLNLTGSSAGGYNVSKQQATYGQRDTTSCMSMGAAGGAATTTGDQVYDAAYNQTVNTQKFSTIQNRANAGGTQIFNQNENVTCNKNQCDVINNRWETPYSKVNTVPDVQQYGRVSYRQDYDQSINTQRMNPDLLSAFKKNPYTQSLNSVA